MIFKIPPFYGKPFYTYMVSPSAGTKIDIPLVVAHERRESRTEKRRTQPNPQPEEPAISELIIIVSSGYHLQLLLLTLLLSAIARKRVQQRYLVYERSRVFAIAVKRGIIASRLGVASLAEGVAEPFETFVKTISRCGAGRLNVLDMC